MSPRNMAGVRHRTCPNWTCLSDGCGTSDFDQERVALAAAGADRGKAEPAAQRRSSCTIVRGCGRRSRRSDARARRRRRSRSPAPRSAPSIASRVPCDRRRTPRSPRRASRRRSSCPARSRAPPRPLCRGCPREVRELVGDVALGRRSSRAARDRAAPANSSEQTMTHDAPSFTPGALPAVVVPRVEHGLQRGELLVASCRAGRTRRR